MNKRRVGALALGLLVGLIIVAAIWTLPALAQDPPHQLAIEWRSFPEGSHGTLAPPSRYCERNFSLFHAYHILADARPEKVRIRLSGPWRDSVPDYTVTSLYSQNGDPTITLNPLTGDMQDGYATWDGYELGFVSDTHWFVTYEQQILFPRNNYEPSYGIFVKFQDDPTWWYASGYARFYYAGCDVVGDNYLPAILK